MHWRRFTIAGKFDERIAFHNNKVDDWVDGLNASPAAGNFAASTHSVQLTMPENSRTWTVQAGVDDNDNGTLDSSEISRSVKVQFDRAQVSVTAGGFADEMLPVHRKGTLTFSRTGRTDFALPFAVALGGSAVNGTDYQTLPTSLQFAPGQSTFVLNLTAIGDDAVEDEEAAVVSLVAGANYTAAGSPASVLVKDRPVVYLGAASDGSEDGPQDGSFTLHRQGRPEMSFTVVMSYLPSGRARTYEDFGFPVPTVTFSPGETSRVLPVRVWDDRIDEPDSDGIEATVAAGTPYVVTGGPATVTIADNDGDLESRWNSSVPAGWAGGSDRCCTRTGAWTRRGWPRSSTRSSTSSTTPWATRWRWPP